MHIVKHRRLKHQARCAAFAILATIGLGACTGAVSSDGDTCLQRIAADQQPALTASPERLHVLVWNLQKGIQDGWRDDLARLGMDHDLLLLQEVTLQAQIGEGWPGLSAKFAPGFQRPGLDSGVMTLSSLPISVACEFAIREPLLRTPKAAVVTQYPLHMNGARLLVINLHAINFSLGLESYRAQLADLGNLLQQHTGPAIMAGDFNTWTARRQALVSELAALYGLAPAKFEPDFRRSALGNPLDHVYLRGFVVEAARTESVQSSDHNPLLLTLLLD